MGIGDEYLCEEVVAPSGLRLGEVFVPCTAPDDGYFGHYNGGAFATPNPLDRTAVAAWADSRDEVCVQSPDRWHTTPQHVWTSRFSILPP